jgi:hypothetical protein
MNNEELKKYIEGLEESIRGLERDLDELHRELESLRVSRQSMEDLMEEVAKLANQPVGMMFNYGS